MGIVLLLVCVAMELCAGKESKELLREYIDADDDCAVIDHITKSGVFPIDILNYTLWRRKEKATQALLAIDAIDVNYQIDLYSPLCIVVRCYDPLNESLVELLLKRGARVVDTRGYHIIQSARSAATALKLIEHGADAQSKDWYGWTALHRAVLHDRCDVAEALIPFCDVNTRNNDGYTPLDYASSPQMQQLLLSAGAVSSVVK